MLQITVFNRIQHFQRNFDAETLTIVSTVNVNELTDSVAVDDSAAGDLNCRINLQVSDNQIRLEIANLGSCIVLSNGNRLHHGQFETMDLPCAIFAGDSQIEISSVTSHQTSEHQLLRRLPVFGSKSSVHFVPSPGNELSPAPATLNSWFESLSQIQRSTASDSEFFKLAARAIFSPGGLDGCIVLKRIEDEWMIVSQHLPYPEHGISYRSDLVKLAVDEESVIYHASACGQDDVAAALMHSAIVCPVFDAAEQITAIVYGFRCSNRRNSRRGIRDLEAKFVSLIADAISAGMIRLTHEASGARRRVLLQQAFSPKVAEQLENNPNFPVVENREVSVLFADIRRFCAITEKLGCHLTYHLLSDVMDCFTQIIHQHQGVVIDYYGDAISAFWNAPVDQPDHALLACRSAMDIIQSLEKLNSKWMKEIGQQLRVGIGVATGDAQIGNSGSSLRLKYGPQGTTVNVASRLEQATKKTGVPLLVSGTTAEKIENEFSCQRICTANLIGINDPIEVVHVVDSESINEQSEFFKDYDEALSNFENEDYLDAAERLLVLSQRYPDQTLIEFLLGETVPRVSADQHLEIVLKAKQHLDENSHQMQPAAGTIEL